MGARRRQGRVRGCPFLFTMSSVLPSTRVNVELLLFLLPAAKRVSSIVTVLPQNTNFALYQLLPSVGVEWRTSKLAVSQSLVSSYGSLMSTPSAVALAIWILFEARQSR